MATNWQSVIIRISEEIKACRVDGKILWFRGHRKSIWHLRSSLHRFLVDFYNVTEKPWHEQPVQETKRMLRNQFKSYYNEFVTNIWDILRPEERTRWGLIFAMQHHGIPTRLLDFTQSFACAIYFAQLGRSRDDDAAVYLLRPEKLNAKNPLIGGEYLVSLRDDMSDEGSCACTELYHPGVIYNALHNKEFPLLLPMAVNPALTNTRMRVQQGTFVLAGDSFDPIDQQVPEAIEKIVLPKEQFEEVHDWLQMLGIRHFSYFPDIEGLASDMDATRKETLAIAKKIIDEKK